MNGWNVNWQEKIKQLEEQANDPVFQEEQKRIDDERKSAAETALKEAQRRELAALGLSEKDHELLSSGVVTETLAVQAVRSSGVRLTALSGGPGSGKTTAGAVWLADLVMERSSWSGIDGALPAFRAKAMFVTAAKLSRWPRYDDDAMNRILKSTRLVIDDLGAEYVDKSGSYLSLLDEVINERYANKRATLLTTNLRADEFKDRYGERIADRIREVGKFVVVGSSSMRTKQ